MDSVLGTKKTLAFSAQVIVMATLCGIAFAVFIGSQDQRGAAAQLSRGGMVRWRRAFRCLSSSTTAKACAAMAAMRPQSDPAIGAV